MPPSPVPRLDNVVELLLLLDLKLDFRPREKIDFVKRCMLSGRSPRGAIPLEFDLIEDFLESTRSPDALFASPGRKETVADDVVSLLDLFPKTEDLFICSIYARIRSGEGGPSIAGSSDNEGATVCRKEIESRRESLECDGLSCDAEPAFPNPNIILIAGASINPP